MISCLPDSFWIWKRPHGGGGGVTTTTTELETTTSACTTETVRRKHVFEVRGYSSLLSRVGVGSFVRSDAFEVGGYDWAVRWFPRGDTKNGGARSGCASAFAVLLTPGAETRASCDLALVSRRLGVPNLLHRTPPGLLRHAGGGGGSDLAPCLGSSTFVQRNSLEDSPSPYVHGDVLTIECVITVFSFKKASRSPAAAAAPTPSLSQDLVRLLETKEGADVSFKVDGEIFTAHAVVLAMRSPVFKAELYGPMKGKTSGGDHRRRRHISIEDMQADVFRALLHFIYTDALRLPPGIDDDDDLGLGGTSKEFVKHLLVAANRYDVRGLKFLCEKRVCESLTIATVASVFALADQHNCSMLQDACVDFITGSDTLADVMASEAYCQLKSLCPGVMIDLFERATKSSRKNHLA